MTNLILRHDCVNHIFYPSGQRFTFSIFPKVSPAFCPVFSPSFSPTFFPTFSPNCSPLSLLLICLPLFSCNALPIQPHDKWPVTRFNNFQGTSSKLYHIQEVIFGPVVSLQSIVAALPTWKQAGQEARQGRRVNTGGRLNPSVDQSLSGDIFTTFSITQNNIFFVISEILVEKTFSSPQPSSEHTGRQ